jgi:hypothetical protein
MLRSKCSAQVAKDRIFKSALTFARLTEQKQLARKEKMAKMSIGTPQKRA